MPKTFFSTQKLFANNPLLNLPRPKQTLLLIYRCLQISWRATLCLHALELDNLDDLTAITFISEKFSRTQSNYAPLVREAFSIYIYIHQET